MTCRSVLRHRRQPRQTWVLLSWQLKVCCWGDYDTRNTHTGGGEAASRETRRVSPTLSPHVCRITHYIQADSRVVSLSTSRHSEQNSKVLAVWERRQILLILCSSNRKRSSTRVWKTKGQKLVVFTEILWKCLFISLCRRMLTSAHG